MATCDRCGREVVCVTWVVGTPPQPTVLLLEPDAPTYVCADLEHDSPEDGCRVHWSMALPLHDAFCAKAPVPKQPATKRAQAAPEPLP